MHRLILAFVAVGLSLFGIFRLTAAEDQEFVEPITQVDPADIERPDALSTAVVPTDLPSADLASRNAGPHAASCLLRAIRDEVQSQAVDLCTDMVADYRSIVDQEVAYRTAFNDRARAIKVWRLTAIQRVAPLSKPAVALAPQEAALRIKIHKALANYEQLPLNTAQQGNWEIMHRIVAYGIGTEIRRDGPTGDKVNAIGWLLWGNRSYGEPLLVLSGGRPLCRVAPGLQGHPGQFLGMLAQSSVSMSTPFQLEGHSFTVADLVQQEKADCSSSVELTFKLLALSYYVPSDETWIAHDGQKWSISRLVQEEIQQPLRTGACGGSHRLFALSNAYRYRAKQGLPIDGEFKRAETYIREYQRYTLGALQNPDGSFSTEWFTKPANADDAARKIQTTGHIMEWLAQSLPDAELRDPRVTKTIEFLATQLTQDPVKDWSVGPLGHALHALAIYDHRVFGAAQPAAPAAVASAAKPAKTAKRAAKSGDAEEPRTK